MMTDTNHIALARSLAPVIRFCDNEPFLPSHVGITVHDKPQRSPSAPMDVTFEDGVHRVIEYAIWWDWDIQHLYELEHVWLKLDADDQVIGVDASAHGKLFAMRRADGSLPLEAGRVTLYSEPGKHAFHAEAKPIHDLAPRLAAACTDLAGYGTILVQKMFAEAFAGFTAEDHRAVKRYLQDRAFWPAEGFDQAVRLEEATYMTWPELKTYIASRVPQVLAEVRKVQPLLKAVFLDSGDTMVDEGTEIHDEDGNVAEARLIPGARETVERLAAEGYRLVLVADGRKKSFDTVLGHHGIRQLLAAEVISEVVGCSKPDPLMFSTALDAIGLGPEDAADVVMVGNHLGRDINGANRAGLISIWLDWSPRRHKIPEDIDEVPDYIIRTPGELPKLLDYIEQGLSKRATSGTLRAAMEKTVSTRASA
ncbi:hypothetical protein GCM10007989_09330 [Devosia pacifica]|uniref:Hydrolase of the HAD superfamily n=1 Tax=Devosia pacifica TaxID=1335967 RepID=A0A918RYU0_9HYPH|nr:HAD family hydrolase [Devosia pacifica]GHA16427.1 hypothetical protein GCM10007989_09330 [Devosia pacifica]